jgi:hypothetical protein
LLPKEKIVAMGYLEEPQLETFPHLDDPNFWRERAEEARQMAEAIEDFGSKSVLFRIAVDFDRVAARASARLQTSAPKKRG